MRNPKSILITGASSGLGQALAQRYAAPGITLFLCGRNRERLHAVADQCRIAGAETHALVVDASQRFAMASWLRECDHVRPLDLVIANAGISAGTGGGGETAEQSRAIFAVNVDGVMNTILPALDLMRPRKRGQTAIMASLAGYRGLPGAPAYCASKAAVKVWGEGLRGQAARDGIEVSVICPGFVESRITDANDFRMPFLMKADKAARIIAAGLAKNQGRIAFPLPMAFAAWASAVLPDAVMDWIGRKMPEKG